MNVSWAESILMSISYITNVDTSELRLFKGFYILIPTTLVILGYFILGYLIYVLLTISFEGRLKGVMRRIKIEKTVSKLKDHYVICGAGRIGSQIARIFKDEGLPLVLIDKDENRVEELHERGFLAIEGNCMDEYVLKKAGIERAKWVISALPEDSDNMFVILTAKEFNRKIKAAAKANYEKNVVRLKRAGAKIIVLPYSVGGTHLANTILGKETDVGLIHHEKS